MKGKNYSALGILVGAEIQRSCHICLKCGYNSGLGKDKRLELDS